MTLHYPDPETETNIPIVSRTLSGEQVPAHDVLSLPGTVEADVGSIKTFLNTLASIVAGGRAAVDLSATVIGYLANLPTIATRQAPPTANYGGKTTVTTAGTRVVLAAAQALTEGVWVRALDANTGLIYIGTSLVSATAAGTRLAAKESIFLRIDDLNKIYIDSAVNAEGVSYLGW